MRLGMGQLHCAQSVHHESLKVRGGLGVRVDGSLYYRDWPDAAGSNTAWVTGGIGAGMLVCFVSQRAGLWRLPCVLWARQFSARWLVGVVVVGGLLANRGVWGVVKVTLGVAGLVGLPGMNLFLVTSVGGTCGWSSKVSRGSLGNRLSLCFGFVLFFWLFSVM